MILSGIYQTLRVNRISDFGLYLADEDGNEVLLPNRYVSLENKIDDMMEVFVYHDSEDRLVASTEKPYACTGEMAFLRAVDKTVHGVFLDWGLTAKDLFLPNRNMIGHVEANQKYVVYLYRDNITGRTVASMGLKSFISNANLELKRGQKVEIMIAQSAEAGFRVVIDNRHWGMLYNNQIYSSVAIGDKMSAYVRKITEDNRVDVNLQQEGFNEVKTSADKLEAIIRDNGGKLPIHDGSSPQDVSRLTNMSKKVFKRTVGYLMKRGSIEMDENGLRLRLTKQE